MPPTSVLCPWCESATPSGKACVTCGQDLPPPEKPPKPHRTSVGAWVALAVVLLSAAGATGFWLFTPSDGPPKRLSGPPPLTAAEQQAAADKLMDETFPKVDPEPTPRPVVPPPADLADTVWLLPNDYGSRAGCTVPQGVHAELLRQALWLTAREEFGLRVGDELLGEKVPPGLPADRQLRLRGDYPMDRPNGERLQISQGWWAVVQGPRDDEHKLWEGTTVCDFRHNRDGLTTPRVVEADVLTRQLYPKLLKATGFRPQAPRLSDAPVPPGVEELLASLRETDTFAALRALHAEVRAKGESPALLSALARGYATLGLLTDYFWTHTPAAFQARGLLYAQRLLSRFPASADARWVRAFAAACAGDHALALTDLGEATKLAAGKKAPPWADLIDAYVHFDADRLRAERPPAAEPLARLLRFLVAESPHYAAAAASALKASRDYLAADPEGYRVLDSVCRTAGVSQLHGATRAGPKAFAANYRTRLKAIPGLPDGVKRVLAGDAGPADVYAALRAAPDAAEPSWAVLAGVFQDIQYAQAWHRLSFLTTGLGVHPAAEAEELLPALAGHPLRPFVESFRFNWLEERFKIRDKLTEVPNDFLSIRCRAYYDRLHLVDPKAATDWNERTVHATSRAYEHQVMLVRTHTRAGQRGQMAGALTQLSPLAPMTAAQVVLRGNGNDLLRFAEIDRVYAHRAEVLEAFAHHHTQAGRTAEAIAYLKRWIDVSPDWHAYDRLADAYRATGQDDLWEQTLRASLEQEDVALHHAQSNVKLARGLMARGAFAKAEPYALAAAGSGANWALTCAADCEVALEKWEAAEALYRQAAGRYGDPVFEWYYAARATGRLHPADADRAAHSYARRLTGPMSPETAFRAGRFYLMAGDGGRAMEFFLRANDPLQSDTTCLFIALLADAQADRRNRVDALAKLSAVDEKRVGVPLGPVLQAWYALPAPPDAAAVTAAVRELPAASRADAEFYVGWYLANAGLADRAKAHLRAFLAAHSETEELTFHAQQFLKQLETDGRLTLAPR